MKTIETYENLAEILGAELPMPQIPGIEGLDIGVFRRFEKATPFNFYDFQKLDHSIQIFLGDCCEKSLGGLILPILQLYLLRSLSPSGKSLNHAFEVLKKTLSHHSITSNLKISLIGASIRIGDNFSTIINAGDTTAYVVDKNKSAKQVAFLEKHLSGLATLKQIHFKLKNKEALILLCPQLSDVINEQKLENMIKNSRSQSARRLAESIVNQTADFVDELTDLTAIVVVAEHKPKHFPRELTMENTANALPHMRGFISSLLKDFPFTENSSSDLLLCIDEALANSIRHGQSPDPKTNAVTIKWTPLAKGLQFEILDSGPGFEPDLKKWKPPSLDAEKGRGIYIMKNLLDKFEITDVGSGTKALLIKYF